VNGRIGRRAGQFLEDFLVGGPADRADEFRDFDARP